MTEVETVSPREVGQALYRVRLWLALGLVVGLVGGFALALLIPHTYRAQSVVLPVIHSEGDGDSSGALNQLGGVAAMAVGLGGYTNASRAEAMAVLESRSLAEKFVVSHKLVGALTSKRGPFSFGRRERQTNNEEDLLRHAVSRLKRGVLLVSEDRRAGTVTISVDWVDRDVAARWANEIVSLANAELRDRTINEAQRALEFLEAEATRTSVVDVRQTLYRVIEAQLKTISTAKSREDYAFRVVDPATAPDKADFVSPNRALTCLAGGLLGCVCGAGFGLLRTRRNPRARAQHAEFQP